MNESASFSFSLFVSCVDVGFFPFGRRGRRRCCFYTIPCYTAAWRGRLPTGGGKDKEEKERGEREKRGRGNSWIDGRLSGVPTSLHFTFLHFVYSLYNRLSFFRPFLIERFSESEAKVEREREREAQA